MSLMTSEPALRVAVFVGTRADLGPLSPVLAVLDAAADVDLHVLTGVAYDAGDLARALPATTSPDGWAGRVHALDEPIGAMDVQAMLAHGPRIAAGAAQALSRLRPDVFVVLGDRWELLYAVPPAFLAGVPIVHLHGGEVTEGAVDERVRHAVSKLADQHCVASLDAARRLEQMGEQPERIHHTGAPGLDRLASAPVLGDAELSSALGATVRRPLALFTYHPPTAEPGAPVGQWAEEALAATLEHCGTVVATYPGMDAGRDEIIAVLKEAAAADDRVVLIEGLGARYPSLLASVDVVVGNSSSGIIEAATVHVPAVNVGDRQLGRLRGDNVVDTAEGRDAVSAGVARALSPALGAVAAEVVNPYGDGRASERILDIVRAAPGAPRPKPFHHLPHDPVPRDHPAQEAP
jgi:UDP-N-acetylglucosamine 2-epimerase (non-hydrolysing)